MLDFLSEIWNAFANMLLSILPTSPFVKWLDQIGEIPYLSWLNWFVPVGDFILIGVSFLAAVTLFYAWMVVARWVKVIGD